MPAEPPINFETLAKQGGNPATGGYPYQLKASDLQKNFVYAVEEFHYEHFTETSTAGQSGHAQRKIQIKTPIPTPPSSGTHVLGAVNGALTWIATEEC
jgi:hypothetical protein